MAINTSDVKNRKQDISTAELTSNILNAEKSIITETGLLINHGDCNVETKDAIKNLDKLIDDGRATTLIINGTSSDINTAEYADRLKRAKHKIIFVAERLRFTNYCKRFNPFEYSGYAILNSVDIGKTIRNIIAPHFYKEVNELLKESCGLAEVAYNNISQLISWIKKYYNDKHSYEYTFVFYGCPNDLERHFFKLLRNTNLSFVVLNPSNKRFNLSGVATINLDNTEEIKDLNNITYSKIETAAFKTEKNIEKEVFNGSNLGLYKAGVITNCISRNLSCTYEELVVWWNTDMYIRPSFKQIDNTVELPLIFSVVKGVPDDMTNYEYVRSINKYLYNKTFLYTEHDFAAKLLVNGIKNLNNDLSNELELFKRTKNLERLINAKYKVYGFALKNRLLQAVNSILSDKKLNAKLKEDYNDLVEILGMMLLALDANIVNALVGFNFINDNPNIVVINRDENVIDIVSSLFLLLMHKLGFDVIVFVPTRYASVEEYLTDDFFTLNTIGYSRTDISSKDLTELKVNSTKKEAEKASSKRKKLFGLF